MIGQVLAQARGLVTKHAIKQVDRLLSNSGINVWESFARWMPHLVRSRNDIVVAMDWTDFDGDCQATLALNLVTEHGRALPLLWLSVWKDELKDQRNDIEDTCLRLVRGCPVRLLGAVVCVHARDMKEPWCLAASDAEAPAGTLIKHYARRWTIEPSFRDTKDLRFGMGMAEMRIAEPERRHRLLLISAFAMVLLTMLGAAGESGCSSPTHQRRAHTRCFARGACSTN
jgi:hypothetical protein